MTARLTFNDEFNSLSLWNGSSGVWSSNWWYNDEWGLYSKSNGSTLAGNGEQQWYINANYAPTESVKPWAAQDGVLTITAQPAADSVKGLINNYQYTSGMLNTWHSFSQQYGYFEIKADLPAGQGLWPAFWLLPQDGSWPPELDVFEVLGHETNKLYTSVHSNASGSHTLATDGSFVADMASGYHTYAVDWQADKITFYFDGQEVYQTATPPDMHKPMYMITNLAVGGGWPGSPDGSTPWPAELKVDYIRAWDSNPHTNGGAVSAPPTSASAPSSQVSATPAAATGAGTAGNDVLTGSFDADNWIRGYDGDDRIDGGARFNDVNGNTGADTITGRSVVGDWLLGGQGSDLIDATASSGRNIINGNMGNDVVRAGSGGDSLRGGQGDDLIYGGSGSDWISGDKGVDTVTGGGGADTFYHWGEAGLSYVTDFNRWEGDRVQLAHGSNYRTADTAQGVTIDIDGGARLVLQNTSLSNLGDGWIV